MQSYSITTSLEVFTIAWFDLIQVNLLRLRFEAFVSTNICVSRITAYLVSDHYWSGIIGRNYQHSELYAFSLISDQWTPLLPNNNNKHRF